MRTLVFAAAALLAAGCNCGGKLVKVPGCDNDPSLCPPEQPPPQDPPPQQPPPTVCDKGAVAGRVCATDQKTWVNGALVTIDAKDCHNADVHVSGVSGADGSFAIAGVPPGHWTVHAQLGAFQQDTPVDVTAGQTTMLPDNQLCVAQGTVKIAVVTGSGDKIETLLSGLQLQYTTFDGVNFSTGAGPFLSDLSKMKQYDLIFFDCAAAHDSAAGTIDLGTNAAQIRQNLAEYVAQGGSIYASDWALVFPYYAKSGAFDFLMQNGSAVGNPLQTKLLMGYAPQTVNASVADADLAAFLGKSNVSITFPKQTGAVSLHWGLMQNVGTAVKVLVEAPTVQTCNTKDTTCSTAGVTATSIPVAVAVKVTPAGTRGGNIVYTSFHNIAQTGDDVAKILKFIVLRL